MHKKSTVKSLLLVLVSVINHTTTLLVIKSFATCSSTLLCSRHEQGLSTTNQSALSVWRQVTALLGDDMNKLTGWLYLTDDIL